MKKCNANSPQEHNDCGKYYSSWSSRYDEIYDTRVVEFTCGICGHHVYEDETGRRLEGESE